LALTPKSPPATSLANASKDAATQDVFLREVDDALREDQLRTLLRTRGVPIAALVIAALVGLAGYLWYSEHRQAVVNAQGETFILALDQLQSGRTQTAERAMAPLAKDGNPGYRAAVRLTQAGLAEQQHKDADAARSFAAVAADASLPGPYRDLATVREIATNFDKLAPQVVIDRLRPMAVPGKPWFGSAGELVAQAYLKQGKNEAAGVLLASIAKDKSVPDTLRRRARQLAGQLGVDAVEDAAAAARGDEAQ
jgi:hypothetical protein